MGSGFAKKKKQAKMLQEQFQVMQEKMQQAEFHGESGNGLVKVVINGDKELKKLTIHPDCVDKEDLEGLQDLILASLREAYAKVQSSDDLGGLPSLGSFSF